MKDIDKLAINTVRCISLDAIDKAKSGHPGLPLGAAPMGYVLWQKHLSHYSAQPDWHNRDRFVLSAGHGSMLLYALMHLTGYSVSMDDLKDFRQLGSNTPGHPESFITKGIEATTGPLGQGSANAVGMAMAERALAHRFNREGFPVVDHFTYALVSDGDLMEGISAEAASLAGHLGLGKLVYIYDANDITLDGPTSLSFSRENVQKRYESYGWQVIHIGDGDTDIDSIDAGLSAAKNDTTRPSILIVKTTIGYGSPNKGGTSGAHGSPLGADETKATKEALGWPHPPFFVPEPVMEHFAARQKIMQEEYAAWHRMMERYQQQHAALAEAFYTSHADINAGKVPDGWHNSLPSYSPGEALATRVASGKSLQVVAKTFPFFLGGDADLSCSTKTAIKDGQDFDGQTGAGRNIHYGVREHAMAAIANGMAYHGGVRSYTATFFVFSDYMRPSIRLAAMNSLPVVYLWTHDSVAVGEDGPTHQPVEHLASLRAMPNLHVVRPADGVEVNAAWRLAMLRSDGPTAIVLSRQNLPVLASSSEEGALRGGYIVSDCEGAPQLLLLATGSEVSLAVEAQKALSAKGISARVISMVCWEQFECQPKDYRLSVLPDSVPRRISVEAASSFGWAQYAREHVSIDQFGVSAPGPIAMKHLGITLDAVVGKAEQLLANNA